MKHCWQHKLQKELAAQHLANTIQELGYAPDLLTRLAYQYQNEKRDVEFAVIRPADLIGDGQTVNGKIAGIL